MLIAGYKKEKIDNKIINWFIFQTVVSRTCSGLVLVLMLLNQQKSICVRVSAPPRPSSPLLAPPPGSDECVWVGVRVSPVAAVRVRAASSFLRVREDAAQTQAAGAAAVCLSANSCTNTLLLSRSTHSSAGGFHCKGSWEKRMRSGGGGGGGLYHHPRRVSTGGPEASSSNRSQKEPQSVSLLHRRVSFNPDLLPW